MSTLMITAIRNGQQVARYPQMEIHFDGTCWHKAGPIIDGKSEATAALGRDKLIALCKAHDYDAIPADCFAHFGENPSGLLLMDGEEYDAKLRAEKEAALTPAQRERSEISKVSDRAERRINDTDEMNVQDHFSGRATAAAMLKAWRAKYPAAAMKEDAANLRGQAAGERDLAVGALTYDADGWLSQEDQQQRHDKAIAEAIALEKQATDLDTQAATIEEK